MVFVNCNRLPVFSVLLIASLFYSANSTHFRGGILGWRPAQDSRKVVIFWQVAWRRSWDYVTTGCNARGEQKLGEGELRCQQCSSNIIYAPVSFNCTDFNPILDWSTGVGSMEYTYSQNRFTVQYAADFTSYWVDLQNYGSALYWKMITTVNMSVRSDLGRPNSSPVTSMIPIIKVQKGCISTINIPARDPDGDVVRCRWADADKNECPQLQINGGRVCGPLSADSSLDADTCQITFNATGNQGWYAVSVIIEDFQTKNSTQAMSQIPLQFLIDVFPLPGICRKPTIIAPLGSCEILRPNALWVMQIRARQARPTVDITQISTSTPPNVAKTRLAPYPGSDSDFYVTLSWTPTTSEIGQHFVCFFATDDNGVSTDQQCLTLIVTDEQIRSPPSLLPQQSIPNPWTPISANTEQMIFAFDSEIRQPELSSYVRIIKFRGNGAEVVIARYDTSRSNRVYFPEGNRTLFQINTTNLNLRSERTYAVEVDSGAVLGRYNDPCSATKPNDGGRWFFVTEVEPTTTAPPTTTQLPTTTLPTTTELITTALPTTTLPAPTPTPEGITAPVAECSNSGLRVLVPKLIVGDIEPSELHFNDPDCKGSFGNQSVILMETSYDRCGTITRVKSSGLIKYRNTIFSEPLPITDTRITREREIQINIGCDLSLDGINYAVFDPDTSPLVFNLRETASFNFGLLMYFDETFTQSYTALDYPIPVLLRERLYFSARASNPGLHLAIDSCKATPQAEPAAADYFYFILNGCVEDSTVQWHQSPSLSEVRFSIESFEFHRHGLIDTIFISCDVNICSQSDVNSVCQRGCSNDVYEDGDEIQEDNGATRGDAPLRKRRSSEKLNTETEHSQRIPLRYSSSKEKSSGEAATRTWLFDISVLIVNVCLIVIVTVATVVGLKLARRLNRFSQVYLGGKDTTHVQTSVESSAVKFNQAYEIDI